jgi:hypothetical protein
MFHYNHILLHYYKEILSRVFFKPLLIILFVFISQLFSTGIRFQGPIPSELNLQQLEMEYDRICKQIDSVFIQDSAPVIITFYKQADAQVWGIRLPEWGGGGALGFDSIFIPVDKKSAFHESDYFSIIVHELVHISLARSFGYLKIPRWFHEGIAMTLSGELSFEEQVLLSRAILTNSLIPLDSIERLNRFGSAKAQLAYCQSHFAVRFLLQTYGEDLLPELFKEVQRNRSFENACIELFGLNSKEFNVIVKKEIESKYRYAFFFNDETFFWFLILLLAILAFVVTWFRNKRKRRLLEIQDRAENDESDYLEGLTMDTCDTENGPGWFEKENKDSNS